MRIFPFVNSIENFLIPMLDYNFPGIIRNPYLVKMRGGLKIYVRPKIKNVISDIDIFDEVILNDEYNIGDLINNNDAVIDIGANIGLFSLFVQSKFPYVKIYAYEPLSTNFKNLKKNISINHFSNILPFQKAVLGTKKKVTLFISDVNTGAHSIYNIGNMKKCSVSGISLSEIIKTKKPNILKIDCEGAEYEIILKTPKSMLTKIDKIILEQHITSKTKKRFKKESIINYLIDCGFNTKVIKKVVYKNEGEFWVILAINRRIS